MLGNAKGNEMIRELLSLAEIQKADYVRGEHAECFERLAAEASHLPSWQAFSASLAQIAQFDQAIGALAAILAPGETTKDALPAHALDAIAGPPEIPTPPTPPIHAPTPETQAHIQVAEEPRQTKLFKRDIPAKQTKTRIVVFETLRDHGPLRVRDLDDHILKYQQRHIKAPTLYAALANLSNEGLVKQNGDRQWRVARPQSTR